MDTETRRAVTANMQLSGKVTLEVNDKGLNVYLDSRAEEIFDLKMQRTVDRLSSIGV